MESKRNETFGRVIFGTEAIQGLGVDVREASRNPRGKEGRPTPRVRASVLVVDRGPP